MINSSLDAAFQELRAFSWPIVRYRFEMTVTSRMVLPDYAGSTIRGAFGRALRKTACMTHTSDCSLCPLMQTCPYMTIFETPAPEAHQLQKFSKIPNPYIIEAPEWGRKSYEVGEKLSFSIVLIGQAIRNLALIIYSLQKAFARDVAHGTAQLDGVYCVDPIQGELLIYTPSHRSVVEHPTLLRLPESFPVKDSVVFRTVTPMRLQENGRALSPDLITADKLLMTMVRRIGLLLELQCHCSVMLPFKDIKTAVQSCALKKSLQWQDWIRYSSRQHQKMHLGGVVGEIQISDVPDLVYLLLLIGQWTHFGKNASFGLGQYTLG